MNHYIYLLTFKNGMKYIGCRSTKVIPEHDVLYLGSGKALPPKDDRNCIKTILNTFNTRKEAVEAEIQYIKEHDCINSEKYYNLRIATYDKHGDAGVSTNKGKTAETHEHIRQANIKRRMYRGNARTPAQKADDERKRGIKTGPCKAKGKSGINNQGFKPWYYIDPEGNYVEIFETKQEFANVLGVTPRQLGHRFHYTNEHKQAKCKPLKGWTFGNLPRPTNTDVV